MDLMESRVAYQHCRWYDVYPRLAFVLKLIRLMPQERQQVFGERLNHYLDSRQVLCITDFETLSSGNRWYDRVDTLLQSLERLKSAPHLVKQQTSDFLFHLLEDTKSDPPRCA